MTGVAWHEPANPKALACEIAALASESEDRSRRQSMPGPTGESNELALFQRAPLLCAGPGEMTAQAQKRCVEDLGGRAVVTRGNLSAQDLKTLPAMGGVLWWGDEAEGRAYAQALSCRSGPIVQLITELPSMAHVMTERHLCIDTTAAGGNASLLLSAGQ